MTVPMQVSESSHCGSSRGFPGAFLKRSFKGADVWVSV